MNYLLKSHAKNAQDLSFGKLDSSPPSDPESFDVNGLSLPQGGSSGKLQESAAQILGSKGSSGSGDNYSKPLSSLQNAVRMSLVERLVGRTKSFANQNSITHPDQIDEERKS